MSTVVVETYDYKGLPADKSKTGGWMPATFILGIELCERLSTMGIAVNLVTYLTGQMHLPSSMSANIITDFLGTAFFLCLLGGFLADSYLGRYRTVVISAIIQTALVTIPSVKVTSTPMYAYTSLTRELGLFLLDNNSLRSTEMNWREGTIFLVVSTKLPSLHPLPCINSEIDKCKPASSFQMGVLYLSLYLIALGTGGLKSSVSGFGADQFDDSDEKEKATLACFFRRSFFFISTGSLLAVTILVYIQDKVSRSLAYGICSLSMFIAIFIFVGGTKRYRYKRSLGSPISHILQVIVVSAKKRKMVLPVDADFLNENFSLDSRIHHTNQLRFLDKAAIIADGDYVKNGVLDCNPWKLCTVTRVEEVKAMIKILPIWATTILFWTTYAQMLTFSVEQASTMRRSIAGFQIPAGSLSVFVVLSVLITLAVYDRVFIPTWKKWKGRPGLSNLQSIAVGLVLSTLGMTAAAISELKRKSVARDAKETSILPLSVFILIPQFLLVGAGEAFTYTGQLDFFTTQSPRGMKGLSTGLFLTTISVGFFASSFLVVIVQKITSGVNSKGWIGENINTGRLDCFYGLLAILSFVNFVMYIVCAKWYKAQMNEPALQTKYEKSSPEQER